MANTINASTSPAGIVQTADASGILQLQTAGTTAVTIDASQNVGIGTSSPNAKLDVVASSSSVARFANSTVISTIVNSTGSGTSYFGDASTANAWGVNSASNYVSAWTNNTERMRIDSSGNLLVGTTSALVTPSRIAVVYPGDTTWGIGFKSTYSTGGGQPCTFINSSNAVIGYIGTSGTATSYITSSDQRLKTNIADAPSALASVNAIQVRSFDFISDNSHQEYGYIAQELLEVAPEAVSVPEDATQMLGVDFGRLTPRLVKAIQEQQTLIEALAARLTALEAK